LNSKGIKLNSEGIKLNSKGIKLLFDMSLKRRIDTASMSGNSKKIKIEIDDSLCNLPRLEPDNDTTSVNVGCRSNLIPTSASSRMATNVTTHSIGPYMVPQQRQQQQQQPQLPLANPTTLYGPFGSMYGGMFATATTIPSTLPVSAYGYMMSQQQQQQQQQLFAGPATLYDALGSIYRDTLATATTVPSTLPISAYGPPFAEEGCVGIRHRKMTGYGTLMPIPHVTEWMNEWIDVM
jgi:hypothetical protein